ncbi:hypothetical protein N7460_007893 [Penicillium canescens]|uniref:Uncharacterized protein n=1 Tax=Penicillium canescens TaxID=5083 RepID=A0AAD6I8Z5_PENCN|nr:hypothetical protein N7460_007893 [Penicillium canescens]KAJ6061208.1 hypothetical protein N7444_001904 [Penicillium canescens]
MEAFTSPELKLLGEGAAYGACFPEHAQSSEDSRVADIDQLYGIVDLLQRGGRWGISQAFTGVLFFGTGTQGWYLILRYPNQTWSD